MSLAEDIQDALAGLEGYCAILRRIGEAAPRAGIPAATLASARYLEQQMREQITYLAKLGGAPVADVVPWRAD